MSVEYNGPVVDPRVGLRIAVEYNRRDNAARMRPPTVWLTERVEAEEADDES
jgi:hypothetical protein